MAKFVVVKQAPETLRKEEYIIEQPTFLEEIRANGTKAPRSGLTANNHLRTIVGTIGQNYDPELTAWSVRTNSYEGRPFKTHEEMSAIILDMLSTQYPRIFDQYLHHKIKTRPTGTKLIYYVGTLSSALPFYQQGIDLLEERDIETYLGLKPKKVVGKPAITKEEADARTTDATES